MLLACSAVEETLLIFISFSSFFVDGLLFFDIKVATGSYEF